MFIFFFFRPQKSDNVSKPQSSYTHQNMTEPSTLPSSTNDTSSSSQTTQTTSTSLISSNNTPPKYSSDAIENLRQIIIKNSEEMENVVNNSNLPFNKVPMLNLDRSLPSSPEIQKAEQSNATATASGSNVSSTTTNASLMSNPG